MSSIQLPGINGTPIHVFGRLAWSRANSIPVMVTCGMCQEPFDVEEARDEYQSEFGEGVDYGEQYGGGACADCAISDTNSNYNTGLAIVMMNGDADYDDEHVQNYL
ncbi:hypothetical protein ABIA31_002871 [Catenulispora sp. MAP5-51]|uniref:hypothetical protein n=1 Tax=Catenulispora sp. MAP5-51 TaxID=3156298 RepID=UPI0035124342